MSRILAAAAGRTASASAPDPSVPELVVDVPGRLAALDEARLRSHRLGRVRAQLAAFGYGAALLSDPMNLRYATGTRNMQVWTMHAPGRYAFVPVEGPVVLFEFGATRHLHDGNGVVDELRTSTPAFYFMTGPRLPEKVERWASEIVDLMAEHGGAERRLAVDRCEPWHAHALEAAGITLFDAQEPLELARMIKSAEELQCLQVAIDVADVAVERMRAALEPGVTEQQLWAILHETNIAHGGEWIEARLLSSGPRTNPWFNECSPRVVEAGDLVAFDTDMVGPTGYLADISRTLLCPGRAPTAAQQRLYDLALEQVLTNVALIEPGMTFAEFGRICWPVPDEFVDNRYMMMVHGAGLVDEAPVVAYEADAAEWGYDGVFEENMVVCVESYLGERGGQEGVKLEEQVVVTATGAVAMSSAPLVDALEV